MTSMSTKKSWRKQMETSEVVVDPTDRKSTRLNSSHVSTSYAVFCLKKKITGAAVSNEHECAGRLRVACELGEDATVTVRQQVLLPFARRQPHQLVDLFVRSEDPGLH